MSDSTEYVEDTANQEFFVTISGNSSNPPIRFESDGALAPSVKHPTARQINDRDAKYTELLAAYVSISKKRNQIKEWHKWTFFWLVIAACVVFLVVAVGTIRRIMDSNDPDLIVSAIPIVVAAFASLVTAVIGIPLAITNFLFNTKEDDNITEIIKHTQEHDAVGRNLFKDDFSEQNPPGK